MIRSTPGLSVTIAIFFIYFFILCGMWRGTGRETQETFLKESFPNPSKNLLTGYRSSTLFQVKDYGNYVLSRGILPTAKLWCILPRTQGYASIPFSSSGKIPRNFTSARRNSVPRQGVWQLNLKTKSPIGRLLFEKPYFYCEMNTLIRLPCVFIAACVNSSLVLQVVSLF